MKIRLSVYLLSVLTTVGCNSSPHTTLLVVNGTCGAAPCALSVGGNPSSNNPPGPPSGGGMSMDMGTIRSASACLVISSAGIARDSLTLTLQDSGGGAWHAVPFIPDASAGWTVSVPPPTGITNPAVNPADPCTVDGMTAGMGPT
jgi:hypothetical protein